MIWHYKHFSVRQDNVTWKVGTDSVLLGSWCRVPPDSIILDIGAGTGILSLMVAQRFPEVRITAVEIDERTSTIACENFERSPWPDRLELINADIMSLSEVEKFDHIICNPPYFVGDIKAKGDQRRLARNSEGFTPVALALLFRKMLTRNGSLSLVYPLLRSDQLIEEVQRCGLYLQRRCDVRHHSHSRVTRSLMDFSSEHVQAERSELVLYQGNKQTTAYTELIKPFQRDTLEKAAR